MPTLVNNPSYIMTNRILLLLCVLCCVELGVQAQDHAASMASSPFRAGDPLPTLTIHSDALRSDDPVILVRYLGFGCTHCVRQLSYLNTHAAALKARGIRVVAFSEDDAETNADLIKRMGYDSDALRIEADVDNASARLIGAVRSDNGVERDLHMSMVVHHGKVLMSVYGDQPYMDVEHLVQTALRAATVAKVSVTDASYLTNYLTMPVTAHVVAGPDDGVRSPIDLDFNKGALHANDLWVVTTDTRGHGVAIIHDAGLPTQAVRLKKDSRASHFMWRTLGIAFGDNGAFATAQSGWPGNGDANYMFMGPTLWSADTAIFASKYQESNDFLASHLDMLHQSPYGMGIAHERDNVYWVSDAKYKDVTRYDFRDPHEVGGTDHRDGIILRYSQVSLTPVDRTHPAHVAFDAASSWLYIVDPGGKRILRLDTRTGVAVENLTPPDESMENLAQFGRMDSAVVETVIDTGLVDPVGIDVKGGRLIVGDQATGHIRMYDLSSGVPVYMGSIDTKATEVLGVTIGPDDHIWCVDRATGTVLRLQTAPTVVMRPIERVVLAGTAAPRSTSLRMSHDGTTDRTFRVAVRGTLPQGWTATLANDEITVGAGGTRDLGLTITADTGSAPITIEIEAVETGAGAGLPLRTSLVAVPDDLRRVIVDDGTTESFNINDAVARTTRQGYIGITADAFLRVADSLSALETVMWFGGSFGEFTVTDESVIASLIERQIDCFVIADDPFALRSEEDASSQFFGRFGVQWQGVDVPANVDNGRRVYDGVTGDPVTDGMMLIDCQLPRLDHHRGGRFVPSVRFRKNSTSAVPMLVNRDNLAISAFRSEKTDLRTIILGINPTRMLDEGLRTSILDKGLEWLEGAAPVPTGVTDDVAPRSTMLLAGANPFQYRTAVRLGAHDDVDVALYTVAGQRIATLYRGATMSGTVIDVDASTVAAGTYFVIARTQESIEHVTIVKQ